MGFKILGGKGNGVEAGVTQNHRLQIEAETNLKGFFVSRDDGRAFNWASIDSSADAGDFICYLKNTSTTRLLYIDLIRVSAVNAALWKIHKVTGTATGTTITGANMNLSQSFAPEATSLGSGAVGGLTSSSVIAPARSGVADSKSIPFDDILILGEGDAVAVEYDTGTTGAAEVLIRGYYEELDR